MGAGSVQSVAELGLVLLLLCHLQSPTDFTLVQKGAAIIWYCLWSLRYQRVFLIFLLHPQLLAIPAAPKGPLSTRLSLLEVDCCFLLCSAMLLSLCSPGQASVLSRAFEPGFLCFPAPPLHGSQTLPFSCGRFRSGFCLVLVHNPGPKGVPPLSSGKTALASALSPGAVSGTLPVLWEWISWPLPGAEGFV